MDDTAHIDLMPEPSAPKLMFFGDPHGDFEPVIAAVERPRPEAIVLLGDLQPRQPLHIELQPILDRTGVWFIHGNHDTDSDADYDHLWGSELADRNLHGRIVSIAGYRVARLGGIFRSKIWDPRRPIEEASFFSDIRPRILGVTPPRGAGAAHSLRIAKAKSSPGCNPTARPTNPWSHSTTPSGRSTGTRTGWWSAAPSWASTPKPAPLCAPTSKGPIHEAADPLRPASRVRTFQAGA
jgi:hypothetical protein